MSSVVPPAPARTPLPEGTIPVGIGLLLAGFATYAFFRVGTVAVGGPDEFEPLASLWFVTFALAPGLFLPLEQELGRADLAPPGARPRVAAGHPEGRPTGSGHGGDRGALHGDRRPVPGVVVLRRRLDHGGRSGVDLRRLCPCPPGTRHLLGQWPVHRIRDHHGLRRHRPHRALRRVGDHRDHGGRRLRLGDRHLAAVRRGLRVPAGRPAERTRAGSRLARGHTEPGLAAPRLDLRRDVAQRRSDRRECTRR